MGHLLQQNQGDCLSQQRKTFVNDSREFTSSIMKTLTYFMKVVRVSLQGGGNKVLVHVSLKILCFSAST